MAADRERPGEDPLRDAAARRGRARALQSRKVRWSYRELDEAADRVARLVLGSAAAGKLGPGTAVATLLPTGPAAVAALHGVPRAGTAVAPLQPRWKEAELAAYLTRLLPAALLCDPATEATARRAAGRAPTSGMPVLRIPAAHGDWADPAGGDAEPGTGGGPDAADGGAVGDPDPAGGDAEAGGRPDAAGGPLPGERPAGARPDDVHTVIATSGTSGRPRAVRLTLASHLASARASIARLSLGPGDRWLASLSLAHVGGVAMVLRSAVAGSTLVLRPRFEAAELLRLARAGAVTHASLVPAMLRRVVRAVEERAGNEGERPGRGPIRGLRCLLVGGDRADPTLVRRAHALGLPVALTYGLTEAASQVATAPPVRARRKPESVGRPLEGVELRIAERGEILVRGPVIMAGYVEEPEGAEPGGTAAEPAAEGRSASISASGSAGVRPDGWLPTGDAGRIDAEGALHVTGRLSERIVTGGVTVPPAEVEEVLRRHPGVGDAVVVGLPDPEWGERIAAAVEPAGSGPATAAPGPSDSTPVSGRSSPSARSCPPVSAGALEAHCRRRLSSSRRPRQFLLLERLPRNSNGKPDRPAIRALFARERG